LAHKHPDREGAHTIGPAVSYFGSALMIMVGSLVYGRVELTAIFVGLSMCFYIIYRLFHGRGVLHIAVLTLAFSAAFISVESDPYEIAPVALIYASVFLAMFSLYLESLKGLDNAKEVMLAGMPYTVGMGTAAFAGLLALRYLVPTSPTYLTATLMVVIASAALYLLAREM